MQHVGTLAVGSLAHLELPFAIQKAQQVWDEGGKGCVLACKHGNNCLSCAAFVQLGVPLFDSVSFVPRTQTQEEFYHKRLAKLMIPIMPMDASRMSQLGWKY